MILSAQEFNSQFLMMPEQEQQKVADFVLSRQSKFNRKPFKTIIEKPLQTEGEKVLAILENTGLLGCIENDDGALSENYKAYLYSSEPIEEGQVSSIYKAFDEAGLIGCIETDEQLSTTYKEKIDFSFKHGAAK